MRLIYYTIIFFIFPATLPGAQETTSVSSTEIFTLSIYLIGFPLFYNTLKSVDLPGFMYFLITYIFLVISNIFTVAEGFFFPELFNLVEHLALALSSISMFFAIHAFITKNRSPGKKGV